MDEHNPFAQEEEPGDIASVAYRCVDSSLIMNYSCSVFFVVLIRIV